MDTLALILFALAALGGLYLASRHFRGKSLPFPVTIVHGLAAATGLGLVAVIYFRGGQEGIGWPLLLLLVAALGGFFLLSFHLRSRRAPNAAVIIHALVAVLGVGLLLFAVL